MCPQQLACLHAFFCGLCRNYIENRKYLPYLYRQQYLHAELLQKMKQSPTLAFTLLFLSLVINTCCTSFRLMRNKELCINIPTPNTYNFQYQISGENEDQIYCRIENSQYQILQEITRKKHYETVINVTNDKGEARICFHLLDNLEKLVSFDLLPLSDPMRGQIVEKNMNNLYSRMEVLYRNMERLYRNQHFYYERNRVHKEILGNLQSKLRIMKVWKVLVLVLGGWFQIWLVKRIINKKNPQGKSKIIQTPYQEVVSR